MIGAGYPNGEKNDFIYLVMFIDDGKGDKNCVR